MILSTTPAIDGRPIAEYIGLVSGEAIMGANVFRDIAAAVRDVIGGRASAYERQIRDAKDLAVGEMVDQATEMGADAIVGIDLDFETIGQSMLMVSASGTAVRLG